MPNRTTWETQQATEASMRILGSSTRIFYFNEAVSLDIASSERADACWVTIGRKNPKPNTKQILKKDLSDFLHYYDIDVNECQSISIGDQSYSDNPWRALQSNRIKNIVYFVAPEAGGNTKIGFTTDLFGRFKTLQAQSPSILEVLGVIPGRVQKVQQKGFQPEWSWHAGDVQRHQLFGKRAHHDQARG